MPSGFPNSIDSFTNPLASSPLNSPSHAVQHQDLNDAVNKIETFMGLVFVKSQTVGTAVSSVTVSDAFSSLYDNYRIIYTGGTGSALGQFTMQLNSVATGYYMSGFGSTFAAGTFVGDFVNNDTRWRTCGVHAAGGNVLDVEIYCPFLAMKTFIKTNYTFYSSGYAMAAGECTDANSRTGLVIAPASGTLTGGTIRVYGYRK
jgi:hypothetical protein